MLRSEVGKQTGLRLTPTLEFLADAVPENASHIDGLLGAAASATPRSPRSRQTRPSR